MASRTTTASPVEQALLSDSRVQDVRVLGSGRDAIAWVVPRRPVRAEALEVLLRESLGAEAPRVALVDAIPSSASGAPDDEALSRLSTVSPDVLQRLEARLRAQGHETVALPGRRQATEHFEPLEELLPERLLPKAGGTSEAPAPAASGGGGAGPARPSLAEGGPLRSPPGAPTTLGETLRWAAEHHPDRAVTFIDTEGRRETVSYARLWQEALLLQGALGALGVRSGERVVVLVEQPGDFMRAFWACILGGVTVVPVAVPPSFEPTQPGVARLLAVCARLGHPLVLTSARVAPALAPLGLKAAVLSARDSAGPGSPVAVSPGAAAVLSFTSGSTGQPKGIVHSHAQLLAMCDATVAGGWFTQEDVGLGWFTLDHVAVLAHPNLIGVRTGTSHVMVARDYVTADILRWMDLLAEFHATQSWAPHFAFGLVAERLEREAPRAWDLSLIRALNCAGEAIVAGTLQRFHAQLARYGLREDALCPMWGMAETSSTLAVTRGVRTHAGEPYVELGPPVAGAALRVVDEQDRVVPEGTVGHLQVRGASVLSGYLDDAALNAQAFTPEGWFRTGDLAVVRNGRMAIAGRQKEVLIINGANVHPHEIEAVVEQVPGVLPSFSAACPTREAGALTDELVLFFVPAPEAPPLGELLRSIRGHVGRTLGLSVNHLVPLAAHQVPKTELGKRVRSELRRRFESGELAAERRKAERLLGGPSTLPRCLAVPRLVPRPQVSASESSARGPLLLLAGAGFATALREQLAGRRPVVWVEAGPAEAEGLARALAAQATEGARFEEVVYVAGHEGGAPRSPREGLVEGIAPLLRLVQALAPVAAQSPLRLRAVAPHPGEGSSRDLASLLVPGLLASVAVEVPGLEAQLLWVPPEVERAAECVAEELTGLRLAREVSWREGVRWERAVTPWVPSRLEAPRHLKPGGFYLVTGALGGIGQAWARHLRKALDARLLLVGRRERDAVAEELERELDARYVSVDLTEGARLQEVVRQAESHLGRSLDGAFHFAGTWQAVPLGEETASGLVQGAATHVLGALAVAEAFHDKPEALLVFASSLMGTLGVEQQASYGAASGFIDRFVEGLSARGRHAVAVAFSPVRATGMARTVRAAPPGCRMLEPGQALASLLLAVESGRSGSFLAGVEGSAWPWRAVGLGTGEPLEQAHLFFTPAAGGAPPTVEAGLPVALHPLASLPRRTDGTVDREALATELSVMLGEGPLSPLEEVVAEAFREVLGVSEVSARTDFFALGGSSLQATRVVARLNDRLGVRLRELTLFENPSVSRLAAWLQRSVNLDEVDVSVLSDAQVDLLLRVLGPSGAP